MDVVSAAIAAATIKSPTALGLSLFAGAVTSIGPCAAPRYVALASLMAASRSAIWQRIVGFVAGILCGSTALVLASRTAVIAASSSSITYVGLAIAFFAFGVWMIVKPERHCDAAPLSMGASLFLGVSTTLLVSPCCTPVFVALGAIAAAAPSPWFAVGAAIAYSTGHVAGLLMAATCARRTWLWPRFELSGAMQTVSAGLMIALGCYYAVLA